MDITERLEKILEKDQVIARNFNQREIMINADIEAAIAEIRMLRANARPPAMFTRVDGCELMRCSHYINGVCHHPGPCKFRLSNSNKVSLTAA